MSVIRRPDVLGRRTRRRVAGLSGAAWIAAVETLAVGTWFALVAIESRTAFTAVAGLSVLLFGALVRTGVVASVLGGLGRLNPLRRFASASALAGAWVCWLLVAELVGGWTGIGVAGVLLVVLLALQSAIERRTVRRQVIVPSLASVPVPGIRSALLPAVLLTTGASTMLAVAWFAEWAGTVLILPVVWWTVAVGLDPALAGLVVFALCAFLAQERRLTQLLAD